jgi:hypothetical protein
VTDRCRNFFGLFFCPGGELLDRYLAANPRRGLSCKSTLLGTCPEKCSLLPNFRLIYDFSDRLHPRCEHSISSASVRV